MPGNFPLHDPIDINQITEESENAKNEAVLLRTLNPTQRSIQQFEDRIYELKDDKQKLEQEKKWYRAEATKYQDYKTKHDVLKRAKTEMYIGNIGSVILVTGGAFVPTFAPENKALWWFGLMVMLFGIALTVFVRLFIILFWHKMLGKEEQV
ncbi:hypothetical protein JD969_11380 [Planctomycetota bacterium]|nr:hypothetical protein JD969_11380 [Planctomycetota bacterium]